MGVVRRDDDEVLGPERPHDLPLDVRAAGVTFLSADSHKWLLGLLGIAIRHRTAVLAFSAVPVEERSWLYLLRLTAFVLILWAIWDKNARQRP